MNNAFLNVVHASKRSYEGLIGQHINQTHWFVVKMSCQQDYVLSGNELFNFDSLKNTTKVCNKMHRNGNR